MKFGAFLAFLLLSTAAPAALLDRGSGLIYDDVLNITWLQDANYIHTTGFDSDGRIPWPDAVAWASELNYYDSVRGVWYSDWRLPMTALPDASCDLQPPTPIDTLPVHAYGYGCSGGELGHLFYLDGITPAGPGPFVNIEADIYWSGTEYSPSPIYAWYFDFRNGYQYIADAGLGNGGIVSWAIRDGDVAGQVVPIPPGVWLLGSALGVMGLMRRKAA